MGTAPHAGSRTAATGAWPSVEHHPITRLLDGGWFETWLRESRPEDRIVAYADKRARQRLVSLDDRFASWRRRHPGWDGDAEAEVRRRAGRLEEVVCEAAGVPGGGPPAALDGRRLQGRGSAMSPAAPPSVALLWGDDDLATARAVDGIAAAHAAGSGIPLERWEVRGDAGAATDLIGQIVERLSTPVMFGGGTMAVVNNVGPLLRRNDHRDALFGAIGTLAPGNAICFVEATPSGTKAVPRSASPTRSPPPAGSCASFARPRAVG